VSQAVACSARASVRVLVVIVSYRTASLTVACLQSLQAEVSNCRSIRVVVVDNASGDATQVKAAIEANEWGDWVTLLVAPRNGGFSYGNNRGIAPTLDWQQPPDYFLLLNADTEVRGRAVGALVDFMDAHPTVGIAGSSFENPDGTDWPLAFRFPSIAGQFEQAVRLGIVTRLLRHWVVARTMGHQPAEVDWVAGASMMIRRQVIEDVGLMDEAYFLYFEEVDYCLQARRAGWSCWYVPQSRVMHICGQSTGVSSPQQNTRPLPDYWFASRSRFFVKNHGVVYARFADLAFGLGLILRYLRRRITGLVVAEPQRLLSDFWRTSVLFIRGEALRRRIGEIRDV
jgi:N-acetylglucosaminyl-diphospho-decaprenol L-rhamnosyltransferase